MITGALLNRIASGVVIGLIALVAVGYVKFNYAIDAEYALCRENNEVVVCNCMAQGYTAKRNIFTEIPLIGAIMRDTQQSIDLHLAGVRVDCGVLA